MTLAFSVPFELLRDYLERGLCTEFIESLGLKHTCDVVRKTLLQDGHFSFCWKGKRQICVAILTFSRRGSRP